MTDTQDSTPVQARRARQRKLTTLKAMGALAFAALTPLLAFEWRETAAQGLPPHSRMLGLELEPLWSSERRTSPNQPGVSSVPALEGAARARERARIEVHISTATAALTASEAGLEIDVGETLAQARREYARAGFISRFGQWLKSGFSSSPELRLVLREDAQRMSLALDTLEQSLLARPFMGGFRIAGRDIVADYPRAGQTLDRVHARRALQRALATGERRIRGVSHAAPAPLPNDAIDRLVNSAKAAIAQPVSLVEPLSGRRLEVPRGALLSALRVKPAPRATDPPELAFDAAALRGELTDACAALESEPVPARFVIDAQDRVHIVPSSAGARLDPELLSEALLAAALSPGRVGRLPLLYDREAEPSTASLRELGVRGLVSTFTTRHPCCEARVANIHRIADLLDGVVVKPGETLSVNTMVGPRTQKNGFVPAPTIEEGEMVETLGGGISQFATTLFNAVFYGGYEIIERQPHSYWFPRYPMGHEATLSYPKPDLIFRNDTPAALLIDTQYTEKSITVRLFGDNGGRKVQARVSPRQNVVEPSVEILPNPSLPPDRERTLQAGMVGWSVWVARVIQFPDGTQKEERRKVTYRPKVRRVEVHPCRVPEGEKGYTGEPCPEPEEEPTAEDAPKPT